MEKPKVFWKRHIFFLMVGAILLGWALPRPALSASWLRYYNGTGNDYDKAAAIATDQAGNVYVTGISTSLRTDTASGLLAYDYVTIKYGPNGNRRWTKSYNNNGDDNHHRPTAIAVDQRNGDVYVTGQSENSGVSAAGVYATVKYDTNGNEKWARRFSGVPVPNNGNDKATAIAVDSAGNVYVTGEAWLPGGSGTNNGTDICTISYDLNGNFRWSRRHHNSLDLGNPPWGGASAIVVDSTDKVIVTGTTQDPNDSTNTVYATVKYDNAGNYLWDAKYKYYLFSNNEAAAVAADDAGNIYVTGVSRDRTASDTCYATVKYDPFGNQIWAQPYQGMPGGDDYATDIKVDAFGWAIVTGASAATNPWGSGWNYDIVTLRYEPSLGLVQGKWRYAGETGGGFDMPARVAIKRWAGWGPGGAPNGEPDGMIQQFFVTGTSNSDFITLQYDPHRISQDPSALGGEFGIARFAGQGVSVDNAFAIALDIWGNVFVTGYSQGSGSGSYDFATIKYHIAQGPQNDVPWLLLLLD